MVASTSTYDPTIDANTFYISDFDIETSLDKTGNATGVDDVSVNRHQDLSYDVAVMCDLNLALIKETFCVLVDSNLELDGNEQFNATDISYVFNAEKAAALVNNLLERHSNSIREFAAQASGPLSTTGNLSDTDGPEFDDYLTPYDKATGDNGVDSDGIACTTSGQTSTSGRFGNGQVQEDFMRHLSYRLFNVPTAADVLQNSIEVSNDFREKFLTAFADALIKKSALTETDVTSSFTFLDGGKSSVTAQNSTSADPVINFTPNGADEATVNYLPSDACEKLWDKLVTYSRNQDVNPLPGTDDARWGEIQGNSTQGVSDVDNDQVARTRIQMLLKSGDQLVFTLRVNFADNQLTQTSMEGRRTSRVYKIIANIKDYELI